MSVVYTRSDSVGRKIIPAPLISVTKDYQIDDDGTKRGTNYNITLTGTILPFKGSPSGSYSTLNQAFYTLGGYPPDEAISGNNEDFNHILRKQEALRWLFSEDGGALEWQPSNGQPPVKCYPRLRSINFTDGQWADRCDYTIELDAPWVYINGTTDIEDNIATDCILASTETWSFEEINGRNGTQYKVAHEVSAKGKLAYDGTGSLYDNKNAWEHAKIFVDNKITGNIDSSIMFAALGATDKIVGHYNNIIRIDKSGGTYNVTEEWLLSDGNTYEERQFTIDYDQNKGEYDITYQGTIYGVGAVTKSGNINNMNQAKSAIPSMDTARNTAINYVGSLLDEKSIPDYPNRKSISLNQQEGTVNFTYQWNTSDDNTVFISEEAQHSYSLDTLLNTLTYTQTIEGKGFSASERFTNAKNAIYSDSIALSNGMNLADTNLSYSLSSKMKSFDKRGGTVRANWTWTDTDSHNIDTTIQVQDAVPVLATIPIPGRAIGPIIQDMGTKTSKIITVTIRSKRNAVQPTLNTELYGDGGTIINDSTTWNPNTGSAERTTRFLKET